MRYDSQRGFETGKRRFMRGRVALYAVLMLAGLGAFTACCALAFSTATPGIRLR